MADSRTDIDKPGILNYAGSKKVLKKIRGQVTRTLRISLKELPLAKSELM